MYKLSKIYSLLTMPLPLPYRTLPITIFSPQIMFSLSQISVPVCQANTKILASSVILVDTLTLILIIHLLII